MRSLISRPSSLTSPRSAAAGGVILVLRFAAGSVLNYAFGAALAWLLVPTAFGAVSALQNVLLLAAGVLMAGLPWALAVKLARGGGHVEADAQAFRFALLGNLAISLLMSLTLVVGQLAGLRIIPTEGFAVTATVACAVPIMGLNTVLSGALQGSRRFGGLGAMQSGEVLVKSVVGLALVVGLHAGAEGIALGFLVGAICATAIAGRSLRGLLPGFGRLAKIRSFAMAGPIWLGTASLTVLLTADILALGPLGRHHGVTARMVAAYQVCAILARALFYVTDALIDAVFPFMVASRDSRTDSHRWFVAATRWVPLAVVPIQLGLVLAPGLVLRLFFPHSYDRYGSLLQLITVGTLGLLLTNMVVKGLYALRNARLVGTRMPWIVVGEFAALGVLVPRFGLNGAATAYCLAGWAGVFVLAPAYLRVQGIGGPGWSVAARYLCALVPTAAIMVAARLLPDQLAWVLMALALMCFVLVARLEHLFTDEEVQRFRNAAAVARARIRSARLRTHHGEP